jgi:hypothetical protein
VAADAESRFLALLEMTRFFLAIQCLGELGTE